VRRLREAGYGPELRSMQAIGYRHVNRVADGIDTLANALVEMQKDTRRFARRQRTWLRPLPDVHWHHPADREGIVSRVAAFLSGAAPSDAEADAETSAAGDAGYPDPR
jgi:tRNA dimethylallyltransferase